MTVFMYDMLYQHFNKYISISEKEFEECKPLFRHKKYRKHQYILQNGDLSRYETFILSGCTRTYEVDDRGAGTYHSVWISNLVGWRLTQLFNGQSKPL